MRKSLLILCICALLAVLCLTGCGETPHHHTWTEATCTEPSTCTECGATAGQPLGHNWVEASCLAPRTCSICGLTEGDPLPHDFTPATYWEIPVCRVCGSASGSTLRPDFAQYGYTTFSVPLTPFDYTTTCDLDDKQTTTANATVVYADVAPQNAKTGLGLTELEGYTWYLIQSEYVFSDLNAQNYSMNVAWTIDDYYDIKFADDSAVTDPTTKITTFSVHWKDGDYSQCQRLVARSSYSLWIEAQCTFYLDVLVRIPTGYDGLCIAPIDTGVEWPEGMYCCDVLDPRTVIYFRFMPQG